MKHLVFLFMGMGVYGLLYESYAGAFISFGMSGLVAYGHRKMLREEAQAHTKSDRDSLSQK